MRPMSATALTTTGRPSGRHSLSTPRRHSSRVSPIPPSPHDGRGVHRAGGPSSETIHVQSDPTRIPRTPCPRVRRRLPHAARRARAGRASVHPGAQRSAHCRGHAGAAPRPAKPSRSSRVACLSTRHRLLAWHVLSRGTRSGTSVSLPDVFVPACLTPGTTALLVAHNHPSGDPTPSADDARLTRRLAHAADVIDIPLLDHLIVGSDGRYYSFREAGVLPPRGAGLSRGSDSAPSITPRMVGRSSGSSSLSLRSTPLGAHGLDGPSGPPRLGTYVMAGSL